MKPKQNLEQLIKRLHLKAGADFHQRTISDALRAQAISKKAKPASAGPNIGRIILKSPIVKIAFAALIILTVSFLVFTPNSVEKKDKATVTKITKSPAELLTVASLNMAFRRGGIKAVEKQFEEAVEKLGPRPEKISANELLAEFNGK
jgi:hypothetical protein